jgi:hypothetical protein
MFKTLLHEKLMPPTFQLHFSCQWLCNSKLLSQRIRIETQVVFCGGPMTYIKIASQAFIQLLKLKEGDYAMLPTHNFLPLWVLLYL